MKIAPARPRPSRSAILPLPRRLPGLRARIGALVLVAMLGFGAVVAAYSHGQLAEASRDASRGEAAGIAAAYDAAFERTHLVRPTELQLGLETLVDSNPDLLRASVTAPRPGGGWTTLAAVDVGERRLAVAGADGFVGRPIHRRALVGGRHVAELVAPLHDRAGRPIATLSLRLDLQRSDAVLSRRTWELAAGVALAALLTAGLVFLVLSRGVAQPLERLRRATRAIAGGRLDTRLGWRRRDEIGALAADFDAMAETLHATQRRLEHGNAALRRTQAEQTRLRRIAEAVAAGTDVDDVLHQAAEELAVLLGADAGAVARFDTDEVVLLAHWTGPTSARLRLDRAGAIGQVRTTGATTRAARVIEGPTGPLERVSVAAPVRIDGRLWGAVGAVSISPDGLPDDAAVRLERFAGLVALAITSARGRARLLEQASTDALTGLVNHRAFQEALAEEVARARRRGGTASLALIDLDHFKRVNDEHGHQAGDDVLREVAARLRAQAREGDTLARVGGEEFAWLMPDTTGADACLAAERARSSVAAEPLPVVGRVTISAGVCDLEQAADAGELYRLADGALYWSKHHGRDVVFRYSPDVVEVLSDAEQAARLVRHQALQSVRVLARAVDAKDPSTREHSERVADLAVAIATAAGWPVERAALLRDAGLVHDVGKIAVPESILLKPGPLDPVELDVVRSHAAIGAEIVRDVLGPEQVRWVRGHHERWDGRGYPDGLAGLRIPEGARILAVADAWDVMTSDRPYAPALSHADALRELRRNRGGQFWPPAVAALERVVEAGALPDSAPVHAPAA